MDACAFVFFFFFQAEDGIRDVAVTGVQTCALPIWRRHRAERRTVDPQQAVDGAAVGDEDERPADARRREDRKSTRLNSSHGYISYAVFCLKKKKKKQQLLRKDHRTE